jgi:hypothetical protein
MPDVARTDALASAASAARPHSLTHRELQVLRLVAAWRCTATRRRWTASLAML